MAEIYLSDEQQQHLRSLVAAIGQDAALRERFQADVGAVLSEYGLAGLLPSDMHFEAQLSEAEVSGFALPAHGHADTGHWDFSHADSHLDMTLPFMGNFQIMPRLGPPA
jgi:hypothetical protein